MSNQPKLLLIGVGGLFKDLAESEYFPLETLKSMPNISLVGVDSNSMHMRNLPVDTFLCSDIRGMGGDSFNSEAESRFAEIREPLTTKISQHDLVIVIAGGAGGTGPIFTKFIIDICNRLDIPTITILGGYRLAQKKSEHVATYQLAKDMLFAKTCLIPLKTHEIELQSPVVSESLNYVATTISTCVESIIELLYNTSIDFADLKRKVLDQKGYTLIGYAEGKKASEVYREATDGTFLDFELKKAHGVAYHLQAINHQLATKDLETIEDEISQITHLGTLKKEYMSSIMMEGVAENLRLTILQSGGGIHKTVENKMTLKKTGRLATMVSQNIELQPVKSIKTQDDLRQITDTVRTVRDSSRSVSDMFRQLQDMKGLSIDCDIKTFTRFLDEYGLRPDTARQFSDLAETIERQFSDSFRHVA